jgi:hypothetical protein
MTALQETSSASDSSSRKQFAAFTGALLVIRILQLVTIGWFSGGTEFSDDVAHQSVYAADPLQLLLGRTTPYEVFPPLFPIVLWSIHAPISWVLSPFYAIRMSMFVIELLAWPFVWWIIARVASGRNRLLLSIAYIAAPVCWFVSVIMAQDEVVGLVVIAAVVVALLKNRLSLAIFLCGVGVVVAKVYFLVPLVGLLGVVANRTWKQWWRDVLIGMAPIVGVYGLQALLSGRGGFVFDAFDRFTLVYSVSVNIWAVIDRLAVLSNEEARRLSSAIALVLSMLPLVMIRLRGTAATAKEQVGVIVAMLLWVYASFYHMNSEYYLFLVPGVFVVFRPMAATAITIFGFSLPWAVNFFHGIGIGMARGDAGRAAFVRVYQAVTSIDPWTLHGISAVLAEAVTLLLAAILTWKRLGTATRALA